MFGPLLFEESKSERNNESQTKCLLCEDTFNLEYSLPVFAAHLFNVHDIIIEEIQNIPNLDEYVSKKYTRFYTIITKSLLFFSGMFCIGEKGLNVYH